MRTALSLLLFFIGFAALEAHEGATGWMRFFSVVMIVFAFTAFGTLHQDRR